MIIYHAAYDLNFFGISTLVIEGTFWTVFARITQIIFIITTGITCALGSNVRKQVTHSIVLLTIAMTITLITWIFFGDLSIKFGILHFFAVAILLAIPLKKLGYWNTLLGSVILGISVFINHKTAIPWLFPLGFTTASFQSLDFFPLIPWFGVFLLGVAFGSWIKDVNFEKYRPFFVNPILEKIGQRSFLIYLIHQPIILTAIFGFTRL